MIHHDKFRPEPISVACPSGGFAAQKAATCRNLTFTLDSSSLFAFFGLKPPMGADDHALQDESLDSEDEESEASGSVSEWRCC